MCCRNHKCNLHTNRTSASTKLMTVMKIVGIVTNDKATNHMVMPLGIARWHQMMQIWSTHRCALLFIGQSLVPLCWHGLTLVPALVTNYIHYKMWDEITYPFPIFNGLQPLKFGKGYVISPIIPSMGYITGALYTYVDILWLWDLTLTSSGYRAVCVSTISKCNNSWWRH